MKTCKLDDEGDLRDEIKKLKPGRTLNSFSDEKYFSAPTMSLKNSLVRKDRLGLVAEIKKASPSKGVIKPDFDHMKIAETYFKCGVDAISILTDKNFFQGDIRYISDIAEIKNVPLLRKDFIIDDATWIISSLIVDTRDCWPMKDVLIPAQCIKGIFCAESKIIVNNCQEADLELLHNCHNKLINQPNKYLNLNTKNELRL